MCFDQELVHIAGDNSATQRGHVSFQLDTDPEAMTLILLPGTVAYVKDSLFKKKTNQNTPTQTGFALVKFCTKRRSCDTSRNGQASEYVYTASVVRGEITCSLQTSRFICHVVSNQLQR